MAMMQFGLPRLGTGQTPGASLCTASSGPAPNLFPLLALGLQGVVAATGKGLSHAKARHAAGTF